MPKPKISLGQAIKTVQSQVNAQITKAVLLLYEGTPVFKFRPRGVLVDAETGRIIERPAPRIDLLQAIKIVKEKAKVDGVITEAALEYEDGRLVCEVETIKSKTGHQVQMTPLQARSSKSRNRKMMTEIRIIAHLLLVGGVGGPAAT